MYHQSEGRQRPDSTPIINQDRTYTGSSALLVDALRPECPVSIIRPEKLRVRAKEFLKHFPGQPMYAVKCNPDTAVIMTLLESGLTAFDVASLWEVKHLRAHSADAKLYFMHPRKPREAIREAYHGYGVRAFVLDSAEELQKILDELPGANDLELFVRIAMRKSKVVATDFSSKFGASPALGTELLKAARPHCKKLGLSFHVGTQCMEPKTYARAVGVAVDLIRSSGVDVEVMDVGGGFPAVLDKKNPPPPFSDYAAIIKATLAAKGLQGIELMCEPGRGLVSGCGSLIVRVEGRRDDLLYLNDGTYGGMFEAGGAIGLPYPAKLLRPEGKNPSKKMMGFRLAGPTCDSVDMMNGPFMLPEDIREGDWIEFDQLGAYGEVSRTNFNGFGTSLSVVMSEVKASAKKKIRAVA